MSVPPRAGPTPYRGCDTARAPPPESVARGGGRPSEPRAVFPRLSALENVRIALQRREHGASFDFWSSSRVLERLDARARELLGMVGLADAAGLPARELPYGRKRALEIATTLALDPELLLLDQPTAGMGHEDV